MFLGKSDDLPRLLDSLPLRPAFTVAFSLTGQPSLVEPHPVLVSVRVAPKSKASSAYRSRLINGGVVDTRKSKSKGYRA